FTFEYGNFFHTTTMIQKSSTESENNVFTPRNVAALYLESKSTLNMKQWLLNFKNQMKENHNRDIDINYRSFTDAVKRLKSRDNAALEGTKVEAHSSSERTDGGISMRSEVPGKRAILKGEALAAPLQSMRYSFEKYSMIPPR